MDITPFTEYVIDLLGVVLTGLGGYALNLLKSRYDLLKDDAVRGYLNTALENGIKYGLDKLKTEASNISKISMNNQVVQHAISYVLNSVPDAINHFKLSNEQISNMLLARLPAIKGDN